jgi:Tol biopolymer transport system component
MIVAGSCLSLLSSVLSPAWASAATGAAGAGRGDVVYVDSASGDLYLDSHVDGAIRRLTWTGGAHDPAWSPDGRTITYDRAGDIWLLTVGGPRRRLTFDGRSADPAFSADGKTIAYSRDVGAGLRDIFLVPAAGGASRRLSSAARSGCSASQPTWTVTGPAVVYVRSNPGTGTCSQGLVRQRLGSTGALIVAAPADHPVFTTDGSHLVFLAPCDRELCNGQGVWTTTASGADRHPVAGILVQEWTCAEGDRCLEAIAGSPFGGWAEAGTWGDPDTGQVSTCFQGVMENADGDETLTDPSLCVSVISVDFAVRPA